MVCLTGTLLLLSLTIPVAAESSTISSISLTDGYTGTNTGTMTITGTNFNETLVKVRLYLDSDTTNITGSVSSHSSNVIKCSFIIPSSETIGTWSVVVVNKDGSEAVDSDAFTIHKTMTLTSVSPTTGQTNNASVAFKVVGTGLSEVSSVYLYNSGYTNVSAIINDVESTDVTGTFDLTDVSVATYQVCVMDSVGTQKCGLSFEITTDQVGEIDISSTPAGASVYVDSTYVGITPYAMKNVVVGSHVIKLTKDGYLDWSKIVKVTNGGTSTVDADLSAITTTSVTTVPTSTPTTVKTSLKVTTVKVPTTYPKTTTAKASPVEGAVVLGAIGLGIVALHRKQ